VSKTTESAEKLSFRPGLVLISSCLRQEKMLKASAVKSMNATKGICLIRVYYLLKIGGKDRLFNGHSLPDLTLITHNFS